MKKSELRTIIRRIVREEVAMSIQEVITELKQPTQPVKPKPNLNKTKRINEKKIFSNNSIINEVLNETAQSATNDYETLGGGTFDSSRMGEIMSRQYENQGMDSGQQLAASMGVDPNNAPDFLTKNYSGVLKAMDKKAKQTRGQ